MVKKWCKNGQSGGHFLDRGVKVVKKWCKNCILGVKMGQNGFFPTGVKVV